MHGSWQMSLYLQCPSSYPKGWLYSELSWWVTLTRELNREQICLVHVSTWGVFPALESSLPNSGTELSHSPTLVFRAVWPEGLVRTPGSCAAQQHSKRPGRAATLQSKASGPVWPWNFVILTQASACLKGFTGFSVASPTVPGQGN